MPTVFGHDIVTNHLARFPMRTPVFFLRRSVRPASSTESYD